MLFLCQKSASIVAMAFFNGFYNHHVLGHLKLLVLSLTNLFLFFFLFFFYNPIGMGIINSPNQLVIYLNNLGFQVAFSHCYFWFVFFFAIMDLWFMLLSLTVLFITELSFNSEEERLDNLRLDTCKFAKLSFLVKLVLTPNHGQVTTENEILYCKATFLQSFCLFMVVSRCLVQKWNLVYFNFIYFFFNFLYYSSRSLNSPFALSIDCLRLFPFITKHIICFFFFVKNQLP